ncbi:MAG: DNA polymerase III subunit gamma/tau [Gammaproteobacteria bacterium]|nr:DNA polymerase III subunit gamma/tau [Gammaproteobacteria bacterium]
MSQQVLARKWRPTRFSDLIGQDHVRKALSHALDTNRLHHAYLFTGTRGVGKTTVARILARCLNCDTGVTASPCGTCHACTAIEAGRFVDLIEVDAASRTKVDDTRELLENVSYAPNQGRYKVYLIDEVHMLSTHSFNALLKTLEEPPPHVIFLLATTDPQKVLPTVLSRCLQFHLRDLAPDLVAAHLATVLQGEGISYEDDALWHLARAGRGSVRDAMTLLDQAIAYGEGVVRTADVIVMLGQQGQSEIPTLLLQVAQNDGAALLRQIDALSGLAPDWLQCVSAVQSTLHQVALAQVSAETQGHLPSASREQISALAAAMHPEFVQLAYQFALQGYRDLPLTPDPRTGFEMVMLRMLAFRPARAREFPSAVATAPISETNSDDHPRPSPSLAPETPRKPSSEPSKLSSPSPAPSTENPTAQSAAASEHVEEGPPWALDAPSTDDREADAAADDQPQKPPSEPTVSPTAKALVDVAAQSPALDPDLLEREEADELVAEPTDPLKVVSVTPENWAVVFEQLGLHGMTGSFAAQMALVSQQATQWSFVTTSEIHRLITEVHRHRIETSLRQATHLEVVVEIQAADSVPETPLQRRERLRLARLTAAKTAFVADPVVKTLLSRFNAVIDQDSIQPLDEEN